LQAVLSQSQIPTQNQHAVAVLASEFNKNGKTRN